jgi:hypothetical protein
VDLAGERTVIAERGSERVAIEIKSFPSRSLVADLHEAVGQYVVYRTLLRPTYPDHVLYLALTRETHDKLMRKGAVFGLGLALTVAAACSVRSADDEDQTHSYPNPYAWKFRSPKAKEAIASHKQRAKDAYGELVKNMKDAMKAAGEAQ